MIVVVDTSGLIAAVNDRSRLHQETNALLDELSERERRPDVALEVLRDVARGRYRLETFGAQDLDEAADVIERYADQNIGLADASNVVLAYRHGTLDILTLDERHFRVLRGPRERPFRLLPADS